MSQPVAEQVQRIFDGADRRRRPQSSYAGDDRRRIPLVDPAGRAAPGADDPPTEQDAYGRDTP